MRYFLFTLSLLIITTAFIFGQSQDSTENRQNQQQTQEQKKTDKFIDRDGDGICDERTQGLGFKRWRHREDKQQSKDQKAQSGKSDATGTVQPTGTGTGKQYRGGK